MSKEQAQNTYLQLQAIENQLKEIQEQVVHIESKKQEISTMCDGLEELKKSKEGSKTLSPVGLGIYANSKILDTKNLVVNVGSDIFMEKSVDEISKVLKKQLKQFEDLSQNLTQNYQVLVAQAQALQVQLQEASGK